MITRRGSLLHGTVQGDSILMYNPGDVVKSMLILDPFFTGVVRSVDKKTNKITVAWGGGPVSQHDVDEIMPVPFFSNGGFNKTAGRRMRADTEDIVEDILNIPEIGVEEFETAPDLEIQTDFIPSDMEDLLNRQVGAEFYSAYLYYMVAAIFQSKGLVGFQNWMEHQGDGEIDHAMKVYNYLVSTGSKVELPTVPGPALYVGMDVAEITRLVLDHEMGVTQDWKRIGKLAKIQDNPATMKMVQEFMYEQIEEEDAALTLHQRVGLADSGSGILLIDNDLKDRSPIAVTASIGKNRLDSIKAGLKEIANDADTMTCSDCEANKFISKMLQSTYGNEPSAQRTIEEETAKKSSVSIKADWMGSKPVECDFCHKTIETGWFVDGATDLGPWGLMCSRCYSQHGKGIGAGRGQKYDAKSGRKLMGSSKTATGEMSRFDIQPGGEDYEWAKLIENAAKELQRKTKNETRFLEMRPFDKYQGPYARLSTGKLWSGQNEHEFIFERNVGENLVGTITEIVRQMKKEKSAFDNVSITSASDGLRSRRAMYWCAPDRTFKLTKKEQDSGSALCPKCRCEMNREPFTRTEKLLMCPTCGFKVPTSKAVTNIEVKVPDGVNVQVTKTDEAGNEVVGENITGSRRGKLADVDPAKLTEIPRMTISQIADLIYQDWKNVNYAAKPYLEAMSSMQKVSDMYGMDSGVSIIAYFLSNSSSWKGDVAKTVKKELQRRIR